MNKKTIALIIMCGILTIGFGSADAVSTNIVTDGDYVAVNVESDATYAGEEIFITVISPCKDISALGENSDPESKQELRSMINFMGRKKLDEQGRAIFKYNPGDFSGWYSLRIIGADAKLVQAYMFDFAAAEDTYTVLANLKSVESAETVYAMLNDTSDNGALSKYELAALHNSAMNTVYKNFDYCSEKANYLIAESIYNRREEITAGITGNMHDDISSGAVKQALEKLSKVFNEAVLIKCFSSIEKGTVMKEYIRRCPMEMKYVKWKELKKFLLTFIILLRKE